MKIERALNDDGLTVMRYTFRQSWLNEFLLCPERARREWAGETTDHDTAEAAVGTAVHTAAERFMRGDTPSQALEAARRQFRVLSEAPGFKWVKLKTPETAYRHIETCFETWLRHIEPKLGTPLAIEQPFNLKFAEGVVTHDDYPVHMEIWLQGTIDYVDESGVVDYKTGGRLTKYTTDGWQLKRWGIQPTVYTWAANQLMLTDGELPVSFTYAAMCRTGGHAFLTVERLPWHWDWLEEQCWNVVQLLGADVDHWPLNDQHALCSPDWCPAWDSCKGAVQHAAITLTG